jgi:glycosyltransferase involved in cell wall biosynthesis
MRVLVFEPSAGGHVFNYARLLLPPLVEIADSVVVVTRQGALDTPFAQVQLRSMPASIEWDQRVPPPSGSQLARQWSVRRGLRDAIRRHRPDHIYVPTADSVSQALGLARAAGRRDFPPGVEAEGALHRSGFAYPAPSRRRQALYRASGWAHAIAPWTRLFSVDVIAYEWIQRRGGRFAARNALLPDPIETPPPIDQQAARRGLGLPPAGPLFGCVGIIDERKGANLLLAAVRHARLPELGRLVLAGEHSEPIRRLLRTDCADLVDAERVISIDRYLGVEELHHAVAALDLVTTPYYRQLAIASIVLRAAAGGRPVLATDFGWCGRMVPAFGLGWTCNVYDPASFGRAIASSLAQAADWQPTAASRQLLRFHAPENFVAVFTSRLRERLGLPPLAGTIGWDEVIHS